MFGAGGGTSAYIEAEHADLLVLWGSNARETHPIFFHHVLQGLENGARMYSVDPRRTSTAQWADAWLGLDVGTDIALANAIAREIIHAGLVNEAFVAAPPPGSTTTAPPSSRTRWSAPQEITGVAGGPDPRARACLRPRRPRPDLLDAGHHRAPQRRRLRVRADQPRAAHRARRALRLRARAAARAEQRAGRRRHGRHPGQAARRLRPRRRRGARPLRAVWGASISPTPGMHLSQMFEAMERGQLRALYCIGENPAESEANATHARHLLEGLDHLVVQDIFRTATADLADVVLPAAADWCEYEGTVTNSERRVQRVRKAIDPPGQARPDTHIICGIADRLGHAVGRADRRGGVGRAALGVAELAPRDELRPARRARRAAVALPGPRTTPARRCCTPGCGRATRPSGARPRRSRRWSTCRRWTRSPTSSRSGSPPCGCSTRYNSGVQTGGYASPLRRREALRIDAEDGASSASPTASGCGSSRGAVRWRRRWRSTRRCARGWRRSRRTSPKRSTSTC